MKKIILLFVSALSLMCIEATADKPNTDILMEKLEASKGKSGYKQYMGVLADFNNSLKIDEQNGCYKIDDNEQVSLILEIDGGAEDENIWRITKVHASSGSAKAECFVGNYLGIEVPKPPHNPIYLLYKFK